MNFPNLYAEMTVTAVREHNKTDLAYHTERTHAMTNPLDDIRHYSPKLTISQLIKFFEKKKMSLTRGMVQNYIRDGLLPPPAGKRFYTHKHIAALVVICKLKTVFDIPTIQKSLVPLMDDEGLPLEIYSQLMDRVLILNEKIMDAGELQHYDMLLMLLAAELKHRARSASS